MARRPLVWLRWSKRKRKRKRPKERCRETTPHNARRQDEQNETEPLQYCRTTLLQCSRTGRGHGVRDQKTNKGLDPSGRWLIDPIRYDTLQLPSLHSRSSTRSINSTNSTNSIIHSLQIQTLIQFQFQFQFQLPFLQATPPFPPPPSRRDRYTARYRTLRRNTFTHQSQDQSIPARKPSSQIYHHCPPLRIDAHHSFDRPLLEKERSQ